MRYEDASLEMGGISDYREKGFYISIFGFHAYHGSFTCYCY